MCVKCQYKPDVLHELCVLEHTSLPGVPVFIFRFATHLIYQPKLTTMFPGFIVNIPIFNRKGFLKSICQVWPLGYFLWHDTFWTAAAAADASDTHNVNTAHKQRVDCSVCKYGWQSSREGSKILFTSVLDWVGFLLSVVSFSPKACSVVSSNRL